MGEEGYMGRGKERGAGVRYRAGKGRGGEREGRGN